jgi:1,2-diacylglycerol 3-alpha-glucosyltransferase
MIIGIFTDTYPPDINGVATASQTLKEVLESHGHTVVIVTTGLKGQRHYSFDNGILRIPGWSLAFLYDYRLSFFFHSKAYAILKRIPFDIIHVQQEFGISVFGRICARTFDVPLVYTYHTSYEDYSRYVSHGNPLADRIAKHAIKSLVWKIVSLNGEIVTPSQKSRRFLKDYGVTRYINVVPNANDLSQYEGKQDAEKERQFREEHGLIGKNILLYLGRIAFEKNVEEIIEGFNLYKKNSGDDKTTLLLVGGGPETKEIHDIIAKSPYHADILLLGPVPHEATGFYYRMASAFVSASTSETQGLTYSEAIACHTLVIAKYDFNLEGFIEDGVTGFFFNDIDGLVEVFTRVLSLSDSAKEKIRIAAIDRNHSLFSEESYYQRILHVYEKARRTNF